MGRSPEPLPEDGLLSFIRQQLKAATEKRLAKENGNGKRRARAVALTRLASEANTTAANLRRYMKSEREKIPVDTAVHWALAVGVSTESWRQEAERRDPVAQILENVRQINRQLQGKVGTQTGIPGTTRKQILR